MPSSELAQLTVPDADAMRALGVRLASMLRPGDLVVLSGALGAGKTTFTQGIGQGLGVRGPVTSPTFVIAREHPSAHDGPPLVHVDAYRLGSLAELDDLDLDSALPESVTVVEWGEGLAENLADAHVLVRIERGSGQADHLNASPGPESLAEVGDPRVVTVVGVGTRWQGVHL